MLNTQQAQQALQAHANSNTITAQQVAELLNNVSTTFAGIEYVTRVATAAAHKNVLIQKVTRANVQLFSNIKAATQVFANAVKKSAGVDTFQPSSNYYTHTACYSLVQHNTTAELYLYAIYNSADSAYFVDGQPATKQEVAEYLTASAREALLNPKGLVHNVANNVTHDVQVRTIALKNIVTITANKATVTVA